MQKTHQNMRQKWNELARHFRRPRQHFHRWIGVWSLQDDPKHKTPVTMLMPLHEKDLERFKSNIEQTLSNLQHDVSQLRLVCTDNAYEALSGYSIDGVPVVLMREDEVLPEQVKSGTFKDSKGKSRYGWVAQQVIKMSWPNFMEGDDCLVIDADTVINRPTAYMLPDGRRIFFTADDADSAWAGFVEEMLGYPSPIPWSFVAHTMLFQRKYMTGLHRHIEERFQMPWLDAVLKAIENKADSFSEYQLYGSYAVTEARQDHAVHYFYNIKSKTGFDGQPQEKANGRLQRFRFISEHIH